METASARIVAAAAATVTVTDRDGRSLVVRKLNALDRLRLFKAVGAVLAENEPYLGMAMLAASVCSIDAVPVPFPGNEAQVEALVSRLGDAGIAAVAGAAASLRAAAVVAGDPAGN
ncbi:MAG TPA: hypothetical protein VMI52_09020 [Acetobacteraceae bacterium]|nr:hypothetical protein [Acetobacteraceae bacterium]